MVLLVGSAVGGTMWWLLTDLTAQVSPVPSAPGQPAGAGSARGEMLRTALAAGAAVGAGITLALAFRRQHHQELSAAHTTHDATERRVTDLYTKAAEQLGHDKAAVRLAGLYALERLAQDNPGHRQTIVNVLCAYLRMPYTPPPPPDPEWERKQALRRAVETALLVTPATNTPSAAGTDPEGERQVRLTAQTILTDHLRDTRTPGHRETRHAAGSHFWEDMRLDLTGAALMDFDFSCCRATQPRFDGATFTGNARFDRATFTGKAGFDGATFTGNARFDRATFTGKAGFDRATFTRYASFDAATFTGDVGFNGAIFTGNARLVTAAFNGDAVFRAVTFTRDALFNRATFTRGVFFDEAIFTRDAQFNRATFTRNAWFLQATFTGNAEFREATFTHAAQFSRATFSTRPIWPEGWRLKATRERVELVRADACQDDLPV